MKKATSLPLTTRFERSANQYSQLATRNSQLATRNPQPATRSPQPATRNPQPATRSPQPAARSPQPAPHPPLATAPFTARKSSPTGRPANDASVATNSSGSTGLAMCR